VYCDSFAWSPDGTRIAVTDYPDRKKDPWAGEHHVVEVATKKKTPLKLPDNHVVTDWSHDGKHLLTHSFVRGKALGRIHLMNPDGTEHKALTPADQSCSHGRLSPDGTRVLYYGYGPKGEIELRVLDLATGKTTTVAMDAGGTVIPGWYCWSPDGKRIAYVWRQLHEGKPEDVIDKETESHLVVCDPDGKNQKTIATEKGQGQWIITLGHVDWR
jgi:Tol biopolymer transport system component